MKDILRAAIAVPALKVADVTYNKNAILDCIKKADEAGATLLLTPELSLTGATCGDLFHSDLLLENAKQALTELAEAAPEGMTIAVGAPVCAHGCVYNCMAVICDNDIVAFVPKNRLTDSEKRYFSNDFETNGHYPQLGYINYPLFADTLFRDHDGTTVAVCIGDDLYDAPDAEIILNPTATVALVGSKARHRMAVTEQSARSTALCLSVSAGTEESTSDLLYSGHGIFAMNGECLAENKNATDSNYIMIEDIDLGKIRYDRRRKKSNRVATHTTDL